MEQPISSFAHTFESVLRRLMQEGVRGKITLFLLCAFFLFFFIMNEVNPERLTSSSSAVCRISQWQFSRIEKKKKKRSHVSELCCPCLMCTVLGFDRVPWWGTLSISLGCALVTALVVWFIVCPRLRKKMKSECCAKTKFHSHCHGIWFKFPTFCIRPVFCCVKYDSVVFA